MINKTEIFKKALVGQMAWEDIDSATINFFRSIFDVVIASGSISQSQMAEVVGYTRPAAKAHCDILEQRGYLRRLHYRAWSLAETALHDPFYTNAVRGFRNVEKLHRAS